MLSDESSENRHGPPGVNSRSSITHTAADLQVLREIENVYFSSPSEFDACRYVLEHAPAPVSCEEIEKLFIKLKRQQQVVSGKALHLISQQRDNCNREFAEIQNIRGKLSEALETCQQAREQLRTASNNLTISTFIILANFRKREILKSVLVSLELLRSLRSVEQDVAEHLNNKEYFEAIDLILKSKKAASNHKEFTCIADLTLRLQDTLDMTEEKLDSVLSNICYKFDEATFQKLREAYGMLNKTQAAMEQLHMHYASAINESATDAVKNHTNCDKEVKFQDLCQAVKPNRAPMCLLDLCEKLFLIMKSYFLLVKCHVRHDEKDIHSSGVFEIEMNVSREYIRQKLKAGFIRIWHDVQAKVSTFLKSSGLEDYPFEKFIQMLGILRKLTQVAEVFCGDTSDTLQDFIKDQSIVYIKNYHRGRMEELKLFLENEGWEQCPVKTTFNLLNLQEFKQFKKYLVSKTDTSVVTSQSDATSSVNSQDDSVYISKYFKENTNHTPFEIFRNENLTNDDIFGLEPEIDSENESDDEPEELKRDYVDENDRECPKSPSRVKDSVIVANTTLSVLRICGQYLQICRYLPQISLEIVMLMNQLFDYYFYTVHAFFTSDLEIASTTLYTSKLNLVLKRISNSIDTDKNTDKLFCPDLPLHLNLTCEENLYGLSERIVAVESVIFLAKQFELLHPYLETIIAPHQKIIIEHFKDNTLAIATDLRAPVYMCSASKSVDARTALIAMSQVKWDVKNVAVEHSPYVDMLTRKIQVFALRFENISHKITINIEVLSVVWSMVSKFVVHLLVEGYSNAIKCSNAGRGLMQLDYRQLFLKLEKICGLKPIPFQDYVDRYVKAYYLPRKELEEFIRERNEYSNKHLLALVACACENKKDRQALTAVIEDWLTSTRTWKPKIPPPALFLSSLKTDESKISDEDEPPRKEFFTLTELSSESDNEKSDGLLVEK